jgi:hypothetical protein
VQEYCKVFLQQTAILRIAHTQKLLQRHTAKVLQNGARILHGLSLV